jgi:Uma2 family endonuclease
MIGNVHRSRFWWSRFCRRQPERRDATVKRELYAEVAIPDYWIVDPADRSITVVRPGEPDGAVHHTLRWEPGGASAPFELAVPETFP